ncbi:MAG: hypothetical protein CM1200mP38_2440 [Dehalococcoidia bacterium]|nr:MAG: hypothetical protein CM1200mP38_2440 [Dehalococcoidia bacterium]
MVDAVFKGGNEGVMGNALSAIDVAIWDLKSKIKENLFGKLLEVPPDM